MTRSWYISEALTSVHRLNSVINDLTVVEVTKCLELESASGRRRSIIDRLIKRAIRLNEISFSTSLRKKYGNHTSTKQNSVAD